MRRPLTRTFVFILLLLAPFALGQGTPQGTSAQGARESPAPDNSFEPLEQWKTAILGGDASALQAMYSADPAPELASPVGKSTERA